MLIRGYGIRIGLRQFVLNTPAGRGDQGRIRELRREARDFGMPGRNRSRGGIRVLAGWEMYQVVALIRAHE